MSIRLIDVKEVFDYIPQIKLVQQMRDLSINNDLIG